MNEIITGLCVGMLSGSIVSLFVSLFGTIKAYKKYFIDKEEHKIIKENQETKMEEILNIQKEIIKILDNMENSDKDSAIEVLEKIKRELEENCPDQQQINNKEVQ